MRPARSSSFTERPAAANQPSPRLLQDAIEEPFWRISIDHIRDAGILPQKRNDTGEFVWKDMRANFFDGYHGSLAAYAGAGNNLILEHILDTEGGTRRSGRFSKASICSSSVSIAACRN